MRAPRPRPPAGVSATFAILAIAVVAAWGTGQLLSDRFLLSQFLFWIPTLVAVVAAWIATLALLRISRPLAGAAGLGALLLTILLLGVENRPFARTPQESPPGASGDDSAETPPLRLFHQNVNWPNRRHSVPILASIMERDDDVIVISEPGWLLLDGRGKALEQSGWTVLRAGRFAILTRLPVVDLGSLVRRSDLDVVLLRLDASTRGLGVITLGLVDLPSNPLISRRTLAHDLRRLLASVNAPEFDLIVGDLNVTRGSAAISLLFPGMHHAWRDAGTGWSGSWPSPLPLWHIDHLLLASPLEAVRYRLLNVGGLPHRAQEAWIRR